MSKVNTPYSTFKTTVSRAISEFSSNALCRKLEDETATLSDYQAILKTIVHQTYSGPTTFALAGANCPPRHQKARSYLMHHAEEEDGHWEWAVQDLVSTGHPAIDPGATRPTPACTAYIAFNHLVATKMPVARLAIAAVLEGIGAQFGGAYGGRAAQQLGLRREQMKFFCSHGETDKTHIEEIWEVIDECDMSDEDWNDMIYAARMAGIFYKGMYDEAVGA